MLEWYPEFADAYDLLASARREGGGPVAATQAERAAIELSPRNQQAEIYVSDKKYAACVSLAGIVEDQQQSAGRHRRLAHSWRGLPTSRNMASPPPPSPRPANSPSRVLHPHVLDQDAAKRAAAEQTAQSDIADRWPRKLLRGQAGGCGLFPIPGSASGVSSGSAVLKLRTADYKSVLLIGADTFSCEME